MFTYLALAVGHHLLVFALLAVIVAELALVAAAFAPTRIRLLASLDGSLGALAGAILIVGFLRVYFGGKGAEFYLHSGFFWAKLGAFAAVSLLSITPTLRFLAWRRALARDPGFSPAEGDVGRVRRFLKLELLLFPLIPIFAAAMALGYGQF